MQRLQDLIDSREVSVTVGLSVLEFADLLFKRKARERGEKMTPEEMFKYQSEMRKAEM